MTVPTIALCASPPSSVCSPPHQFGSHASYDLDLNSRSSSTTTASSSSRKPILGGLSCLFSSPSSKQHSSSSFSCDDRGEDLKELCSSFSSRFVSSLKKDYSSPISVFQGPFSCSTSHRSGDMSFSGSCRGGSGALFNGFMRSALNTCADFDSSGYDLRVGAVEVVELTFDLEDSEVEEELEPRAKELLLDAQSRHRIFYDELVVKAFHEAEKAHRGQTRASGGPYLQHCVETAVLLAQIGANATLVAAGLLHDTIDDSFVSYDSICRIFGASVADLVEGVSKLSHLSKLARDNNTASKTAEADRLHTMFLGMADARAVLVKLADRLHNMMTLDALPAPKQRRFAKETLEIFVPLANRLGISSWKEQLEDLCFKHLNPDQYKELSSRVLESFDEAFITAAIKKLEQALEDKVISKCRLSGRHKSLYSIHSKMLKKGLRMDEIHDIHGLRLIVENKEDCYKALEVVHQLWSQVPGKFKDYISHPKINGYQSLHTVVMGEGMVPLEVQIRTKEMHLQAEFGIAAHWRYKEGDAEHPSFILQMVEWARWVITWQCETMNRDHTAVDYSGSDSIKPPCRFPSHSDSCLYSYKAHLDQTGPIIVIVIENDKMSVQELPANSTVMDLLEKVGQGNHLRSATYGFPMKEQLRPRLNRRAIGDPSCILRMGDLVELTPALPDKALTEYREEIQRMFDRGPRTGQAQTAANSAISLRS